MNNRNEIKDAKEIFDRIEIPEELDRLVTNLIKADSQKTMNIVHHSRKIRTKIFLGRSIVAAAGVILCFMIALNSSEAFAKSMIDFPVIGSVAKVLTIRSYQTVDENQNISVRVPEIEVDNSKNDHNILTEDTDQFVADINTEIEKIVNNYLADAKARMQADKEAYLATGGTQEEWEQRDLNINVDYEVKYQGTDMLSLVLTADESWYGAYDIKYFYNLDLENNKILTLKEILGEDYVTAVNDNIISQMKARASNDSNLVYWGITDNDNSGIDGFKTVDANTKFYLNQAGKPVVVFDKYEIAPGFMGPQEFIIG